MTKLLSAFIVLSLLMACSNDPDLETGEIKTFQLIKTAFAQSNNKNIFVDSKKLINRKQIDAAGHPMLFVELETGQNGTLVPYPGQGIAKTWLGADGATITLERGIIKASRGMGDDVMGANSSMPNWGSIKKDSPTYNREIKFLDGNNQSKTDVLICAINKNNTKELIRIWEIDFLVTKYEENCNHNGASITNSYYVDDKEIVRRSFQYHGKTIGHLTTERLDR